MRFFRRNVLGVYGVYAASIVSGLVVTPIIVHELGTVEFGLWAFIGSLVVYLALLDFGVGPSVVRFAAEYRGRHAPDETNGLASTGIAVYAVLGLLTLPVGIAISWFVPALIDVPDDLVWPARLATALLVVGSVLRFPLGLFTSLLIGHQRWDVTNLGNALSIVLYAGAVIVLLQLGGGVVLLAALTLLATVVRLAVPLLWLRRELPDLRLQRSLVTRGRARELLAFSWQNFLLHLASKVVFSADVIVVGLVLGAGPAAFYALPAKLFALAFGLGSAATNLLYPTFAELEGQAARQRQQRLLTAGLRAGGMLTLVLALPFVAIPDQLLTAWVGEGFEESVPVLALLGLVLVVHQPLSLLSQFLVAVGRQRRLALLLAGTVAVNVALSIALASWVGIWGVAASTLITDVLALIYVVPALAAPATGLRVLDLVRATLAPAVPAVAAGAVVLVALARVWDAETLLGLAPLGALWMLVGAALVWRFGLGAEEQRSVGRLFGAEGKPVADLGDGP